MGDSITQFWPVQDYDTTNPTLNFGVATQTSAEILARFPRVTGSDAGVVVILAGTNDLLHADDKVVDIASIKAMADEAVAANIRVILCALPPTTFGGVTLAEIQASNQEILELAQTGGYSYADYYDVLLNPDGTQDAALFVDGLHPSPAGYTRMWAVLQPLIADYLR